MKYDTWDKTDRICIECQKIIYQSDSRIEFNHENHTESYCLCAKCLNILEELLRQLDQ